jgi:cytochrome c oxidase subunit 2
MLAKVKVLNDEQWKAWNRGKEIGKLDAVGLGGMAAPKKAATAASGEQGATLSELAKKGEAQFTTRSCVACHSVDGSPKVGPSLKGIWGHEVELADGKKVTVDENYIRESLDVPNAKVVKGFAPAMPPFKGQLAEADYAALIAYIKALK